MWDTLATKSVGLLDLLKIVSNHPSLNYSRDNRWKYLGWERAVFRQGSGPRADRFGLWLDVRSAGCTADLFENEAGTPAWKSARGKTVPVGLLLRLRNWRRRPAAVPES